MSLLKIWDAWEIQVPDGDHRGGSRSAPIEIEVTGLVDDQTFTLATATSLTLWTSAEALTNFDFFWLKADQDLKLELTVDTNASVGSEELVILVESNTPFRLIYDDALANYSGTLSGGTADVIDEVVIRNESGTIANVRRVFVT